jgi:L-2,4-diaminobutyrate decarboxylase
MALFSKPDSTLDDFPASFPMSGLPDEAVFNWFKDQIDSKSAALGAKTAFAHMDPPTPDIAARLVGLNAQFNQNLLHPDLSPFATVAERRVVDWLAPAFGMATGHMCGGSTLANLTALWCAREAGAKRVFASLESHISIAKSAHILGMTFTAVPVTPFGQLDRSQMPDAADAAVVLTAGTTGRGVIDDLTPLTAAWVHVDAAWAGPLIFTRYADRLAGIEHANSVAVSAHKWLYQPKDSALVLFADPAAQEAVSFGGDYLATPNVGVQGSRGAAAIPLLATLLAWGQTGLAARIEKSMADAEALADHLAQDSRTDLKRYPETGVVNWRPTARHVGDVLAQLGSTSSQTKIDGAVWLRQVAANPNADIAKIWARISAAV